MLSITFALLALLTRSGMELHVNAILTLFKVEVAVYQAALLVRLGMVSLAHAALASI
jgi:hypothetical protein